MGKWRTYLGKKKQTSLEWRAKTWRADPRTQLGVLSFKPPVTFLSLLLLPHLALSVCLSSQSRKGRNNNRVHKDRREHWGREPHREEPENSSGRSLEAGSNPWQVSVSILSFLEIIVSDSVWFLFLLVGLWQSLLITVERA